MRKAKAPGGLARGMTQWEQQCSVQGESTATPVHSQMGKVVGHVSSGVLRKRIAASKHFLQVPPAIAWDARALIDAQHLGATACEVLDSESGRTYSAPISLFWSKGIRLNRGFGEQIALPLKHWQVSEPVPTQPNLFEVQP